LVAITLIDIENLIIPDKLNLVGGVVALASALAFPATHAVLEGSPDSALSYRLYQFIGEAGDQPRVWAVVHLAAGAIVGFGLLWCVRTLGRRFWGRAVTQPESPATWLLAKGSLSIDGTDAVSLSALLPNPKDRAIVEIESGQLRDRKVKTHELGQGTVAVGREDVTVAGETRALGKGTKLELQATSWSMPREVLGRGDLKMMAMVGAFVGPDAVLFVVTLGSLLGLVIGGGWILVTGREKRAIPFGPFLAVATLAWLLAGPEMLAAYSSWLRSLIGAPA
jgi:leader peptidase (prepilin peptidase)/N-methyltransferase